MAGPDPGREPGNFSLDFSRGTLGTRAEAGWDGRRPAEGSSRLEDELGTGLIVPRDAV